MNNKECINILNGIINNIGVKGFWFDSFLNSILLRIPINSDNKHYDKGFGFGYWASMDEMFMDIYSSDIRFILECIGNIREDKSKENDYTCNYLLINDIGIDFLKCILNSGSLEEMKLKIQLRGYEI